MYESYYGFKEKPFSLLPDPAFLFLGKKHSAALSILQYGLLNQAGFTVITGEIGCGKTTLIRYLLDHMKQDVTVGLITNTHRTFGDLLQWILLAYGLDFRGKEKAEEYRIFVDFVVGEYARGHRTVLIIDEAQNLDAETLEELRVLSNVNADKDQVLQLILAGQPDLRDTLRAPHLLQFAQRVAADYHLEPLSASETREYIRHRIRVAGGAPGLFGKDACEEVHDYSRGVPRLINILCDTALVYGYAAQRRRITTAIVREVVRDKSRGGLFPGAQQGVDGSQSAASRTETGAQSEVALEADRASPSRTVIAR